MKHSPGSDPRLQRVGTRNVAWIRGQGRKVAGARSAPKLNIDLEMSSTTGAVPYPYPYPYPTRLPSRPCSTALVVHNPTKPHSYSA